MTIYEFKTSLIVVGGSSNAVSLNIPGGICNQLLIRSGSSNTTFRADLKDSEGDMRMYYGFHEGEIRDDTINLPVTGEITIGVTNASIQDSFRIVFAVRER